MVSHAFDRLTNPVVRPASGSIRFIFKPLGMIATELWIALLSATVPWGIALAAVPEVWGTVLVLVGLPMIPLAMYRALRVSVVADDQGLTVKNYWRTRVLAWTDITEVGASLETVGVLPVPVISFVTTKHKIVKAVATAGMDKSKRALIRELKACPELESVPFKLPPKLLA